ncbi:MAG: iron ABC transporter permease [Spirochaetaceae bacterium]|nr:iron ABC transporter permease [Spirochaetaceae bacterium]
MKHGKIPLFVCGVSIALVLLFFAGLLSGGVAIPLRQAVDVLLGKERGSPAAEIILGIRLPRIVMALLIGMMLAAGGTISQAVFRNPLADPYIIGISSGAVTGAALAFLLKLNDVWYGVFGFAGALAASFLVFSLAGKRGKAGTAMLLIVGVAVSAFLGAVSSFALYLAGQDSYRVIVWTMGYLGAASWFRAGLLALPLLASLVFFAYHRHDLDALLLGDAEAHSLGVAVGKTKRRLLLAVSLTAAFSVAFAGMIGFVGLIVPHGVRLCAGNSHSRLLPLASYSGGVFLLLADTLARTLIAPVEIPIGIITALFGAPFFMVLAIRTGKESRYGA